MGRQLLAYYAHPIDIYDAPQEEADLRTIADLGYEVCNPNSPANASAYKLRGMEYFCDLVKTCDLLIFRAFDDGYFGAGVDKEIATAQDKGIPVIELPSALKERALGVEETKRYLQGYRRPKSDLGMVG